MLILNWVNFKCVFLIVSSLVVQSLCDLEAGFSRGCYTACPRKTWNLQSSSRQQLDRQWMECLKDCHKVDSWKFILVLSGVVIMIAGISLLIYICCGQKIRLRYIFHVERNRRKPISSEDQTQMKIFEQGLRTFKQTIYNKEHQICIQFQNDRKQLKKYFVEDVIFEDMKETQLQNLFSITMVNRKQINKQQSENITTQLQQSQNYITQQQPESSRLIGAISLTSKGLNIWWMKIDDKPQNPAQSYKCCTRINKKMYAVYEKDPYAPEASFIGNAVLLDSTKPPQQRFTRYYLKRNQLYPILRNFEQEIIAT